MLLFDIEKEERYLKIMIHLYHLATGYIQKMNNKCLQPLNEGTNKGFEMNTKSMFPTGPKLDQLRGQHEDGSFRSYEMT